MSTLDGTARPGVIVFPADEPIGRWRLEGRRRFHIPRPTFGIHRDSEPRTWGALEAQMVIGLSHVFLLVSRLGRSVHFYRELLGRPPASEDARHARFDLGPISITIHEDLTPAEVSIWKVDPVPERRGWGVYLTFPTDDLEETYRRLVGIGAEILTTPKVTPWGTRMFTAKDPDGYLLELCQRG